MEARNEIAKYTHYSLARLKEVLLVQVDIGFDSGEQKFDGSD